MRVSSPKVDEDGGSFPGDMKDRPVNSDKERLNLMTMNKYETNISLKQSRVLPQFLSTLS